MQDSGLATHTARLGLGEPRPPTLPAWASGSLATHTARLGLGEPRPPAPLTQTPSRASAPSGDVDR